MPPDVLAWIQMLRDVGDINVNTLETLSENLSHYLIIVESVKGLEHSLSNDLVVNS